MISHWGAEPGGERLRRRAAGLVAGTAFALAAVHVGASSFAAETAPAEAAPQPAAVQPAVVQPASDGDARDIQVPPPPFSEGIFPCMSCHEDVEPNPTRRELTFHDEIELRHDERNRWCLDCHDERNRDFLRLASGTLVPFDRSYLLCGQCHGPTLRSWKAGVHGKRTGRWDGQERHYLLCVHCHNPHRPRFPHIRPLPEPITPAELRASLAWPVKPVVFQPVSPFASPPEESQSGHDGE
jgi:hypothetical protein